MNRYLEKSEDKNAGRGLARALSWITSLFSAWLRDGAVRSPQRLRIIERHALAPGQSLVLIEVDGKPVLVASSREASPTFFPLNAPHSTDDDQAHDFDPSRRSVASSIRLEALPERPSSTRPSRRVL